MRHAAALVPLCFLAAACAPNPPEPPVVHHGTCSHYGGELQLQENVPNCLLRNQGTLINGLPPANPFDRS